MGAETSNNQNAYGRKDSEHRIVHADAQRRAEDKKDREGRNCDAKDLLKASPERIELRGDILPVNKKMFDVGKDNLGRTVIRNVAETEKAEKI